MTSYPHLLNTVSKHPKTWWLITRRCYHLQVFVEWDMGMSETNASASRSLAAHQADWQLGPRSHVKKAQLLSRICFFATEGFSIGLQGDWSPAG